MKTSPDLRIAVIPARGGSKRVPGKNIRLLLGKPIIAYTLDAALESGVFDRVIVSTDSPEIAEIALRYGGEVPFLRDASLSDDVVPVSAATVDALGRLDADRSARMHVCQLMANCPLRDAGDIRGSYEQFSESDPESQISVTRFGWQNPWWAMRRSDNLVLEPLFERETTIRSQDLPDLFCPTGAVWWATSDLLRRAGTFHVPGRGGWEIEWAHAVDIDSEDDWFLAETLMRMSQSGDA